MAVGLALVLPLLIGVESARATFPGENGKIAFTSNREGNQDIYVMDSDGTNQTRLTDDPAEEENPTFSLDGKQITFESERGGNRDVYVMDSNGDNETRLTTSSEIQGGPQFSPDGKQITYYNKSNPGSEEVYVMDAKDGNGDGNGDNPIRLTNNNATDWSSTFSPDGTKIAFDSFRDGNWEVYVMNSDGTNQTRLTKNSVVEGRPAFSPDGKQITFYSHRDGNAEIYVMDAKDGNGDGNGDNPIRLTNNSSADYVSVFSPDATEITFYSNRDGDEEIYVMDATDLDKDGNGDNLTPLTSNSSANDKQPNWGPSPNSSEPVDTTAPVTQATRSVEPNAAGWNKEDVTLTLKAQDEADGSGVKHISFSSTGAHEEEATVEGDTAEVKVSEEGETKITYFASDKSDNLEDSLAEDPEKNEITVKIDKTAPTVSFSGGGLADLKTYYYGDPPAGPTSCEAKDEQGGSGLPDGTACTPSGYDTTVGKHTITTSNAIKDNAGNEAKVQSLSYEVLAWTLKGFYQPTDMDTSTAKVVNTVKNGATVPLKFEVFKGTTELTDPANIKNFTYTPIGCTTGMSEDAIEMTTDSGTALRYDVTAGQFIQNWQTPKKPGACYDVKLTAQDGSSIPVAHFKLK